MKNKVGEGSKIVHDLLYSDKVRVEDNNIICNNRKISEYDLLNLFSIPIKKYIEVLSEGIEKYKSPVLSKDRDLEGDKIAFFMTVLMVLYDRINAKYKDSAFFQNDIKEIYNAINDAKRKLGTSYNSFFVRAFLPKDKGMIMNFNYIGIDDLTTENFGEIFETFYDKPKDKKNEEVFKKDNSDFIELLLLSGKKNVLKYLITNRYLTKTLFKEYFCSYIENLWDFYYYGGIYTDDDRALGLVKPLPKEEREEYLEDFFTKADLFALYRANVITSEQMLEVPSVFNKMDYIYLYKSGVMNIKQLSENFDFFDLVNSTYNLEADRENQVLKNVFIGEVQEDEQVQRVLKECFLNSNELMELLSTKEYRKKVDNKTTDIIWSAFISQLISLEDLKILENMNTNTSYKYFDNYRIISSYLDYKNHELLKELELKPQDKDGLFQYYSAEKMIEIVNSSEGAMKHQACEFFNTIMRTIYDEKNIDFEKALIEEQLKQSNENNKDKNLIYLYDSNLINADNLIESEVSTEELKNYYIKIMLDAEKKEDEKEKIILQNKAKKLMFQMTDKGKIDIIDIIDILEQIDNDFDKDEDYYMSQVYKMMSEDEVSSKVVYEYLKSDNKDKTTEQLLEKYDKGTISAKSMRELSSLFDFDLIQKLYNEGKIELEILKEIVGEQKAKDVDEKYDVTGKLEELLKKGGIQGIEVEIKPTGRKRIKKGERKTGHNIDEFTKHYFYREVYNLDKEEGQVDEEPMIISINAPVFKGFVLYAMPNHGIGFMEGENGSTFVVRLKEVLEEADRAYSEKNIIGSSKSRKEFVLDNANVVRKVNHSLNWSRNLILSSNALASKNSEVFANILDKKYKTTNKRIIDIRNTMQDIQDEYKDNLKRKKDSFDAK